MFHGPEVLRNGENLREAADAASMKPMDDQHPPRVVVDPEIMWGAPCLAGSRLPAKTLLDMVDGGDSWELIVDGWPWLTPAHVEAAREFQRGNEKPAG